MINKNKLLFNYLKLNPTITIRDLVIWTEKKPFCFNCGHSAIRNLKKYIKQYGYRLDEEWEGKHEYKIFTMVVDIQEEKPIISNVVNGQCGLFDRKAVGLVG